MKGILWIFFIHLTVRLLPTFRGRKNRFFCYLTKLNSKIQPNVSMEKFLKSLKTPKLFRKAYFWKKVNGSGRCQSEGVRRIPRGNFRSNHSRWGSISMLFPNFVYITHFTKFTRGSSLFMSNSLLMEKSKVEESPWLKKQAQRRSCYSAQNSIFSRTTIYHFHSTSNTFTIGNLISSICAVVSHFS